MKTCPACGYEPTPSKRQLLHLFKKHFGTLPVWEMTHRGWIEECFTLEEATSELMRFFGFKSEADWNEEFPDLSLPVILSPDRQAELQRYIRDRAKAGVRYTGTPKEKWRSVPIPASAG